MQSIYLFCFQFGNKDSQINLLSESVFFHLSKCALLKNYNMGIQDNFAISIQGQKY